MKCDLARNLMSSYIDRELSDLDKSIFEKHIQICKQCKEEYELLLEIVTSCNNIEEVELPSDFHERLHSKLVQEKKSAKNRVLSFYNKSKIKAISGFVAAVFIMAVALNSTSLLDNRFFNSNKNSTESSMPQNEMKRMSDKNYLVEDEVVESDSGAIHNNNAVRDVAFTEIAPQITSFSSKTIKNSALTFDENIDGNSYTVVASEYGLTSASQPSRSAGARKIIKSGSLSLKVKNLDDKLNQLRVIADSSGGYVENSQLNNNTVDIVEYRDIDNEKVMEQTITKSANVVIRIPQTQFDDIFNNIKSMGELQNENISGSDITSQYRDKEASLQNLKLKEKKLQDLLKNKASTVDEILRIENELSNVRTSIDITEGSLRNWDKLIELSTVHVYFAEVTKEELKKVDATDAWGKAKEGFIKTINNISKGLEVLFVWVIASIPYILIIGLPVLIVLLSVIRKIKKTNK